MLAEDTTEQQEELTPGQMIEMLVAIRDEKARLNDRIKELNEQWAGIESRAIELGEKMGMKRITSDLATLTITVNTLPQVDDWDEVYNYILKNDACYILQRRIASAAYRELVETGQEVPGVSTYAQKKVSLRKRQ